jgi:hypothetical protein
MATRTITFTLPAELADKLEEALQTDHVKLEEIAVGWLFFGRGIAEPGAQPGRHEVGLPQGDVNRTSSIFSRWQESYGCVVQLNASGDSRVPRPSGGKAKQQPQVLEREQPIEWRT